MKRILFTVAATILLVGCTPNLTQPQDGASSAPIQVNDRIGEAPRFFSGITKFSYNGHDYIAFTLASSRELNHCIVHDPDCKRCKNK